MVVHRQRQLASLKPNKNNRLQQWLIPVASNVSAMCVDLSDDVVEKNLQWSCSLPKIHTTLTPSYPPHQICVKRHVEKSKTIWFQPFFFMPRKEGNILMVLVFGYLIHWHYITYWQKLCLVVGHLRFILKCLYHHINFSWYSMYSMSFHKLSFDALDG